MTISIKPTASGSTIEQDGSAILSIDASGNLTVPNNLSVTGTAPIPDALSTASGSAPSYSARAWANFNGIGTVAIRSSGNVSSITDNGTGDYTVNFTTAMPDANYSSNVNAGLGNSAVGWMIGFPNAKGVSNYIQAPTTTTMRFAISYNAQASGVDDSAYINVAIFR